jgi:hypothetical protein
MHVEAHFPTRCYYQMLPLSPFVSDQRLKRKDFPEVTRPRWAQEAWSLNLHAPTTRFCFQSHLAGGYLRRKLGPSGSKYKSLDAFDRATLLFRDRVQVNFSRDLRCGMAPSATTLMMARPQQLPLRFVFRLCLRFQPIRPQMDL